jgi:hypothetical protein
MEFNEAPLLHVVPLCTNKRGEDGPTQGVTKAYLPGLHGPGKGLSLTLVFLRLQ